MGVSITYVDDRGRRKLNREHRGKNMTTDVLSFPSSAEKGAFPHLGDIVISLPTAEKMAKKFGVSRRREVETLVIHGRDDRIIPMSNSVTLCQWIERSQLHVFGRCGHWVQIEHAARFSRLVGDFFAEACA